MNNEAFNENFVDHLSRFIGETVTIFTTSGGLSGQGFTGVILSVNHCFVRLITRIGPAPGCSLGNGCTGRLGQNRRCRNDFGCDRNFRNFEDSNFDRFNDNFGFNIGSVTDIPINRIASFVHNAV